MLIVCAITLLAGCGLSDQYSFMPKILRQPSAEPPQPEPEPDVKELVRLGTDKIFTSRPSAIAVSRARPVGRKFSFCVKAVVTGQLSNKPRSVTVLVFIEHGKLADRHPATKYDRCEAETYEKVDL